MKCSRDTTRCNGWPVVASHAEQTSCRKTSLRHQENLNINWALGNAEQIPFILIGVSDGMG